MSRNDYLRLQLLLTTVQDAIRSEVTRRIPDIIRLKRLRALRHALSARLASAMNMPGQLSPA